MSYFVVERSGDAGGLRIPLPTAYETREAAIAALSAATGSGEVTLTGEVFIADLGSAVPVLLMAAATPAPAAAPAEESAPDVPEDVPEDAFDETPEVDLEETAETVESDTIEDDLPVVAMADEPVEVEVDSVAELPETASGDFIIEEAAAAPASLDQESADEVYTSWAPIPDVTTRGAALADAIKRATTTLEDEGVVAPDSVRADPDTDEAPAGELPEAEEALGEEPVVENAEGEVESEWPWANIESYEVPEDGSEPAKVVLEGDEDSETVVAESAGVTSPDRGLEALVESLGEDAPIITSAPPEGEEAYMPHPVILGDYADALPEPEILAEETAVVAEDEPAEEAVSSDSQSEVLSETPGDVEIDASAIPLDGGYAPTGDLDLDEYTCQDCVYSNTCPKVGQVTPAECGSFQWKSE